MSANPPVGARSGSDATALAEAERAGRPFLHFVDPESRQRLFFFESGASSLAVGRLASSDLPLPWDDQVSRLHARFERAQDAWVLVDDGLSSNGTFINEERLSGRRRLSDGDVLRFGSTTVTYRAPRAQSPRAQAPLPQSPPARPREAAPATPGAVSLSTTQRRVLVALCRPCRDRTGLAPLATDQQIADELVLSLAEVKRHLRVLYAKFAIEGLPEAQARVRLAERAFAADMISERDLQDS